MAKPKQPFGIVEVNQPYRVLLRVEAVSPAQAIVYARFVLGKIQRHKPSKLPRKAIAAQLEAQEEAARQKVARTMRLVALEAREEQALFALPPAELREKLIALERDQRPTPGGRRARARREREQMRDTVRQIDAIARRTDEILAAFEAEEDDGSACCIDIAARCRLSERGMSSQRAWRIAVDEERRERLAEARRRKRADHRKQFCFAFVPKEGSQ